VIVKNNVPSLGKFSAVSENFYAMLKKFWILKILPNMYNIPTSSMEVKNEGTAHEKI
jgi:hypothetical protein